MSHTRPNIHPGEILWEEFLKPTGLDVVRLSGDVQIPVEQLRAVMEGTADIYAEMALRLARYFGTSERFWMEIQMCYDLERARQIFAPPAP